MSLVLTLNAKFLKAILHRDAVNNISEAKLMKKNRYLCQSGKLNSKFCSVVMVSLE